MALFVAGGPAGGAPSGALGATVFSHNRFGSYMRARVIPTNPNTAGQVLARNRVSSLSNHWFNTLTAAQRAAWTTYGANVPVTNRIGQQIILTGLNWYIACNSIRSQAGGTIVRVDDAPIIFNLATFDVTAITASFATQEVSVAYTADDPWSTTVGGGLMGYATRPQNESINFNNLPFRFGGAEYGAVSPPTSPFLMPAPFPFAVGQKVFCRFNCFNADARIGAEQRYDAIVAA